MWTVIWLIGMGVFFLCLVHLLRMHQAVTNHTVAWIRFSSEVIGLLPDERERDAAYERARELLFGQFDELRAIKRWPLRPDRVLLDGVTGKDQVH